MERKKYDRLFHPFATRTPTGPITTNFGMAGVLTDVIIWAKFGVRIFKSFRLLWEVNFDFSH